MRNLRQISQVDAPIGAVSKNELTVIASALSELARLAKHPVAKWFVPKPFRDTLQLEMLAATFNRSKVAEVSEPFTIAVQRDLNNG